MLIGDNPKKTNHPKIQKISDPFVPFNKLEVDLNKLKNLIINNKADEVKKLLDKLLKSFKSNAEIVDHIHSQQLSMNK